jgi:hypothetical protein
MSCSCGAKVCRCGDEIRTTLHGMQTKEHDKIVSRISGREHEIMFGPTPSTMEGHTGSKGGLVPANPFASLAQAGYMHSHPEVLGKDALAEWDSATKGKSLPKRAKKSK